MEYGQSIDPKNDADGAYFLAWQKAFKFQGIARQALQFTSLDNTRRNSFTFYVSYTKKLVTSKWNAVKEPQIFSDYSEKTKTFL